MIDYLTPLNILKVVLIIASAYLVSKILEKILTGPLQKRYKESTLIHVKRIIRIIVYISGFLLILWVFNIDVTAAMAGLGIGAIVIGFGLKDIISNWISGIIIVTEKIYRIGDVIMVGNITGVVRDISLRSTKLKTYDRNEVIIPNSTMVNEKVINLTSGKQETISSLVLLIDYTCDTDKAKKIIESIIRKHEKVTVDEKRKREIRFVVRIKEWVVEIETLFWINDPENEEFIRSDIAEKIKKEFEKERILPPMPASLRKEFLERKE
ncbi:MAG: mechanosensitive ion channel family protein [Candidatus Aenigmarchaeota archaeon]|nr:mechanosensitive ion channel family protein [Candidatus Aenigmarchaeota archaeon]